MEVDNGGGKTVQVVVVEVQGGAGGCRWMVLVEAKVQTANVVDVKC